MNDAEWNTSQRAAGSELPTPGSPALATLIQNRDRNLESRYWLGAGLTCIVIQNEGLHCNLVKIIETIIVPSREQHEFY